MSKFLINFCPTGVVNTKTDNPSLPVTVDEIVSDCEMALGKGCQILHLHARCERGEHTGDPEVYRDILSRIRSTEAGREAIICVSTSGRMQNDPISRARVLLLEGNAKPDMASLTLSSLNFIQSASVNPPQTVEYLATQMLEAGIKPELEVFDLGMLNYVHVLIRKNLLRPPFYINLLLGNIATAQANVHHLSALLGSLPSEAVVCVGGLGRYQITANMLGLLFANGARIGLEDNLRLHGELATNAQLIDQLLAQANLLGKQPTPLAEARRTCIGPIMKDYYECYDVKKPILVFGLNTFSELASYLLTNDSPFKVAGYVVDSNYRHSTEKKGLPVFAFEDLERWFSPDDVNLLISLGYAEINGLRRSRYEQAKSRGYSCVSYVSSRAVLWPNFELGENSMIYENTVIQPFATVGNNCIVRSSVHISHHSQVADHSFVSAGVVTGGNVRIGEQSFVGLGSIIRDGVSLAPKTFVGAGALVVKNTEENGLYLGSPARLQTKRADEI